MKQSRTIISNTAKLRRTNRGVVMTPEEKAYSERDLIDAGAFRRDRKVRKQWLKQAAMDTPVIEPEVQRQSIPEAQVGTANLFYGVVINDLAKGLTVGQVIPTFLAHAAASGNSPRTVDSYRLQLTHYARMQHYLNPHPETVLAAVEAYADCGYSENSIRAFSIAIRRFHNWLYEVGWVNANPLQEIRGFLSSTRARPDLHRRGFTDAEMRKLGEAARDHIRYSPTNPRRREPLLLLELGMSMGLRLGEMVTLRLRDLDRRGGDLWLTLPKTKHSKKGRRVLCPHEIVKTVQDYVADSTTERERHPDSDGTTDYLFYGRSRQAVRNRLSAAIRDLMVVSGATLDADGAFRTQSIHEMRRTAITSAVRAGATQHDIMERFGLSWNVAVQHYVNPGRSGDQHRVMGAANDSLRLLRG